MADFTLNELKRRRARLERRLAHLQDRVSNRQPRGGRCYDSAEASALQTALVLYDEEIERAVRRRILRLDPSRPPPSYKVGQDTDGGWYWVRGPQGDEGHRGDVLADETAAREAAWTHYEATTDPPGMRVVQLAGRCDWGVLVEGVHHVAAIDPRGAEPDLTTARAQAWDWYKRRAALAERILNREHIDVWPCLTYSDDRVAEIERCLIGDGLMKVLHG